MYQTNPFCYQKLSLKLKIEALFVLLNKSQSNGIEIIVICNYLFPHQNLKQVKIASKVIKT